MRACMVGVICMLVGVLLPAAVAMAQDTTGLAISGGYSFLQQRGSNTNYPRGWYADLAGHVGRSVWLVGQASGSYLPSELRGEALVSETFHLFAAGPRIARRRGVLRPFGQVLAGVVRQGVDVDTSFPPPTSIRLARTRAAIEVGGGVDVGHGPVGMRAGFGYIRSFAENGGVGSLRLGVGVVLRR